MAAALSLMAAGVDAATSNAPSSTTDLPRADPSAPGSAFSAPPPVESTPTTVRMLPLELTVNGAAVGSWVLLEREGTLYAPVEAFEEWRVNRRSTAVPFTHLDQQWFPLAAVPGFDVQLNFSEQSADILFMPQAFDPTRLSQPVTDRAPLTPSSLSAFANYDLSYTRSALRDAGFTQDLGALMELGFSGDSGVLTSTYVARGLTNSNPLEPRSVRRLETTFTRDLPGSNLSVRLGDTVTRTGSWGRPVYFGGVQIGSNFGLRQGFISQPLPVVSGLSSGPSMVELYINDALRQTSQVPTGPFAISNFPLLTGSGQARIVVRDALGRETVQVQDFFSHAELLEQGLSDWSIEAGAVRHELGASNANYGQRFSSGLWRHGLSKNLTMETHGELGGDARGGGLGLIQALPLNILGQVAVAFSGKNTTSRGGQWLVGLQHSGASHGVTLRGEGASRGYRQIGQDANTLPYQRQLSASYTYSSDHFGALGLGYARVNTYDKGQLTTYSGNYTLRVARRSSLSFNVVRVNGLPGTNSGGTSLGVSLLIPMEQQLSVSSSLSHRSGQTDGYVSASQGPNGETGLGWRALAGQRTGQNYAEGGLYYQGLQGIATADINTSAFQKTVRLGAQGGVVAIGGQVFASRRIQDGFALVEVPGYADVGVGFQGSVLARTNKDGKALVPRLQSHQANSIRLDPSELPISAEIDSIEQVVVPGSRNGVIVRFPVRSGRGALIKIVLDDGQPAPAGAELELVGDKHEFFVARRGEAFVTGLQPANLLRLKWGGVSCTFGVDLPPVDSQDEIARLGPLKCSGVNR